MKKLLVASTALVAVAAVSSAQAADPIKLSVGGSMQQWVGYADSDNDNVTDDSVKYATVRQQSDVQLAFTGSTKLDNGLTVSVVVEQDSDRGDNTNDDVFLSVASDTMGTLTLGATKGYAGTNITGAPDVGIGLGDADNWISEADDTDEDLVNKDDFAGDDGQKIKYVSPSFNGLTVGASYGTHTNAGASGTVDLTTNQTEIETSFGAAYSGEFSGVAVGASAGYTKLADKENDSTAYEATKTVHYGLSLATAGFTVSGGVANIDNFGDTSAATGVKDREAKVWDLGVSYATGPYSVSLSYMDSEYENSANDDTPNSTDVWMVSGSYDLGAGVAAKASVFQVDEHDGSNVTTQENGGWGVVAGLTVAF